MIAPDSWATSPTSVQPPVETGTSSTRATTRKLDQVARLARVSSSWRASSASSGSIRPQPWTVIAEDARNVRSSRTSSTTTSSGTSSWGSSPSSRARICAASISSASRAHSASSVPAGRVAAEIHQATPGTPQTRAYPAISSMTSASGRVVRDQVTWAARKVGSSTTSGYRMSR